MFYLTYINEIEIASYLHFQLWYLSVKCRTHNNDNQNYSQIFTAGGSNHGNDTAN